MRALTVCAVLAAVAACSTAPEATRPSARHFTTEIRRRVGCDYLLHLPADYGKDRRRWPLLLFLHGAGERGTDLALVKRHGPPRIAESDRDFPFVLVSPQCPADEWWDPEVLVALLDEVTSRYRVDPDRIYVTGLSMGGFGTLALAATVPDRLAAIAPVCGGGDPRWAPRLAGVPTWIFHGAGDRIVPVVGSRRMVDAIREAGGSVRLTVYPDLGHVCWDEAYAEPGLWSWLLSHRRPPGAAAEPAPPRRPAAP